MLLTTGYKVCSLFLKTRTVRRSDAAIIETTLQNVMGNDSLSTTTAEAQGIKLRTAFDPNSNPFSSQRAYAYITEIEYTTRASSARRLSDPRRESNYSTQRCLGSGSAIVIQFDSCLGHRNNKC